MKMVEACTGCGEKGMVEFQMVATAGYELHLHVRKIEIIEFQRKWGG